MFTLHGWKTPNCLKIIILLEEKKLPYEILPINLSRGDHLTPRFRQLAFNGKVPVLTGMGLGKSLFESGAILWYLAEYAQAFLPQEKGEKAQAHAWLMWQMSVLAPTFQEGIHYRSGSKLPHIYSVQRLTREATRLCGVLNQQIKDGSVLGTYSIVDMAILPWIRLHERLSLSLETFPILKAWYAAAQERPTTQKALEILGKLSDGPHKAPLSQTA